MSEEVSDNNSYDDLDEDPPKAGAPEWIVTFADLSTLMLTFFILLLSFASTDIQKFKDMLGSVQDAFGVQVETHGKFQPTDQKIQIQPNKSNDNNPMTGSQMGDGYDRNEIAKQEMVKKITKNIESMGETKNIKVKSGPNGVRVRIKGGYFFGIGKAELKKDSLKFLNSIARLMKEFPFKLKVEGHTDNIPISTAKYPSNWELSAVRATTVLRYFIEQKKIKKTKLTAIGFADNKPIASNETNEGRAKNRRVEFIFSK